MPTFKSLRHWRKSGGPWIWLNAAAVGVLILLVVGLVALITVRGLAHFWPKEVLRVVYEEGSGERITLMGQVREREEIGRTRLQEAGVSLSNDDAEIERVVLQTGNRDLTGEDFRWILAPRIAQETRPLSAVVIERTEWGVFIGYLLGVRVDGALVDDSDLWSHFQHHIARTDDLREEIHALERDEIGTINHGLEQLRLRERGLELDAVSDPEPYRQIEIERTNLQLRYLEYEEQLGQLYNAIGQDSVILETADGRQLELPMAEVVKAWRPNAMGAGAKLAHFFEAFWAFVSEAPREANTEGGVFPAIFGTVLMVMIMSIVVFPFGVIAGVYLREYARQGWLTQTVRIAVNNLAGVPSIVYGVFGLGFFIYVVGGNIDQLFFEESLPMPTFGTGGLFWASLTLALLTLPVVIIATEEGLARIPRSVREGSLALGATRWETLRRTVLPMASPGIMTGLILAVAVLQVAPFTVSS
jgi:phosphate transport system permease protein